MTAAAYGFPARVQRAEEGWGDWNGHLNMAFYNVLFDRGYEDFLASLGITADTVAAGTGSTFTLEAHVTYLREVMIGDEVRVWTRVLDWDAKRMHLVQVMEKLRDGEVAATSENMVLHVSLDTRRAAPFAAEVAARLAAVAAEHAALPVPPQVGHRIGIPRK